MADNKAFSIEVREIPPNYDNIMIKIFIIDSSKTFLKAYFKITHFQAESGRETKAERVELETETNPPQSQTKDDLMYKIDDVPPW